MLPPSDSLNHQNFKMAEFAASLRSQNRLAPPPPPPTYAAATVPVPVEDTFADIFENDDEERVAVAPVTIKIDTSINIEGQGNTIVIPTAIGASMSEEPAISTSSSTSQSSSPSTGGNSPIQQLQKQRPVKSAQLASIIISAVKASGILDDKEAGRQRPIEINVASGIRIRGDRNAVCAGVPKRYELTHGGSARSSTDEKESSSPSGWARKRRAGSQPIDIPSAKKIQL